MLLIGLNHLGNEESTSHSEEELLADPHEDNEAEDKHVGEGTSLKSCHHLIVKVWSCDLSCGVLVHLDWSLDELTSDLSILISWVVDACVKQLVYLHESEEGNDNEHNVGKAFTSDAEYHGHDEAVGVVNPNEVIHLVEALVQQDALEKNLHSSVSLELRKHLDNVQQHEEDELGSVDQVPEVLEVIESLFLQLDQFE